SPSVRTDTLTLIDCPAGGNALPGSCGPSAVERAVFTKVPILSTVLDPAGGGIGKDLLPIGGVLGGDLLQQFSLRLHYDPDNPDPAQRSSIALLPPEIACSCALANADACEVVLPFKLAGGGTYALEG